MGIVKVALQSLWIGSRLSPMEIMCIKSYQQNGHEFHLYTYGQVVNVPVGTILKDANEILPKENIFIDSFGGYVNLSNKFRYTLLFKKGGWWVDMDTVCLRPFVFGDDYIFSSEHSDPYNRSLVNTTFIKSLPGQKYLLDCINFIDSRGLDNLHWGELGVNLISRMIFRYDLGKFVKTPEYFCPVSPYQFGRLVKETTYKLPNEAFALHWWHEIWKQRKLDKHATYHHTSLYEQMKLRFGIVEGC